jgi:hypothetical protein
LLFWKVPWLHLSVLLVRATCSWRWRGSIGEMILTGESWRTQGEKTCPNANLSITVLTCTGLESNQGLCSEIADA